MINKNKYQITSNKPILHKKGKKWIVISLSALALAIGITVSPMVNIHASNTNKVPTTQQVSKSATNLHSELLNKNAQNSKALKAVKPNSSTTNKKSSAFINPALINGPRVYVNYIDEKSNIPVKSIRKVEPKGASFNIQDYVSNVPNDYKNPIVNGPFINKVGSYNQPINIYVAKASDKNSVKLFNTQPATSAETNNIAKNTGMDYVNYVFNGRVVGTGFMESNPVNQKDENILRQYVWDYAAYHQIDNLPSDYQISNDIYKEYYDYFGNVSDNMYGDMHVDIPVQLATSTITIDYKDKASNENVGKSVNDTQPINTSFDVNKYTQDIPSGYKFANDVQGNVQKFDHNDHTVTIFLNKEANSSVSNTNNHRSSASKASSKASSASSKITPSSSSSKAQSASNKSKSSANSQGSSTNSKSASSSAKASGSNSSAVIPSKSNNSKNSKASSQGSKASSNSKSTANSGNSKLASSANSSKVTPSAKSNPSNSASKNSSANSSANSQSAKSMNSQSNNSNKSQASTKSNKANANSKANQNSNSGSNAQNSNQQKNNNSNKPSVPDVPKSASDSQNSSNTNDSTNAISGSNSASDGFVFAPNLDFNFGNSSASSEPTSNSDNFSSQSVSSSQSASNVPTYNHTNLKYPIKYAKNMSKPDQVIYKGHKYNVHYHANGKNTIYVKNHHSNKAHQIVVSSNLPVPHVSSDNLVRLIDKINFNKSVRKAKNLRQLNRDMDNMNAGQVVSYKGNRLAKVSMSKHFRYVLLAKNVIAHKFIGDIGSNNKKNIKHILKANHNATLLITNIAVFHGKHANYIRYQVKVGKSKYWITGRNDYVPNAYYQENELKHSNKRAKLLSNCNEYNFAKFNRKTYVRKLHRGNVLHIKRIVLVNKPNYQQTRLELTNGHYVTANKNYVKLLKRQR